ncbi:uncharacterized protein LOC143781070 [Ranitomeya variabilis]|uniref:uncharacterized protein LOC143781070 n=1 Tax=Ranitomeya variabilis TaxID=490064 RepID=UPI004055CD74
MEHNCWPRIWSGPSSDSHGPVPAIQQRCSKWAFHTNWRPGSWSIMSSPFAVLFHCPFFLGSSWQRQRASDRSLMPEFLHLSSVLHDAIKALSNRMDISHNLLNARIQEVTKSLEQVKADLQRPPHHFFNQIEQGMSEHLTPDLQLSVMQACNATYVQAMQQSQYFQQTVSAYPPVPSLSRLTSMPTSAAYHCTATSIPSTAGHHYSTTTMPSAVGHPTATTMTTAAPAWTSSTDTMMQQNPGMAFRTATTTMQQDPGMAFRTATTTMQQDPGMAFPYRHHHDAAGPWHSLAYRHHHDAAGPWHGLVLYKRYGLWHGCKF